MRRGIATSITGALLALCAPATLLADDKGDKIIYEAEEHTLLGYDGAESVIEMILTNKRGTVRKRKLHTISNKKDDMNRVLARFQEPPDVAGTAFLVREVKDEDDEQFLYIPALKKVRRISSSQKGGSFMGTDFSYDDLQSHEVTESENKIIREEKLKNQDCWVIESTPKPGVSSEYSRSLRWIRKKDYVPIRMELFKKGDPNKLHKEMVVFQVGKKDGRVVVRDAEMHNVLKKHKTRIKMLSIEMNKSFSDDDFSKQALEKGR